VKLSPAQLPKQLAGTLLPVYAISGDEPLLCQEAADAIRVACKQAGYGERQVLNADTHFDWGRLYEAGASLSLFAEKTLLDVRLPSGKPGDKGTAALLEYLSNPPADKILLLSLPKLDSSTQKSKWCKALAEHKSTGFVQIWPIEAAALPSWISQRLAAAGISADNEATTLLAERVEGNLLAAAQEIEKLKLLEHNGALTVESVQAAVADSARFDVFGLIDSALQGDAAHALRNLHGLRGEGIDSVVILWALARELRTLATLAATQAQGTSLNQAFNSIRPPIWEKRRPLITRALQKQSLNTLSALLCLAAQIDAQIKGQAAGDPWAGLTELCLTLCGKPLYLPNSY